MAIRKSFDPRRIRKFKRVDENNRRNPQSIRRLIFNIIWNEFNKDATKAAEFLSEKLKNTKLKRKYQVGFSGDVLYKVSRDIQKVSYLQLESIAKKYGVPTSLILLYTRIYSEIESADSHRSIEAIRIINAFKIAADKLEEIARNIPVELVSLDEYMTHEKFIEVIEAYDDKFHSLLV